MPWAQRRMSFGWIGSLSIPPPRGLPIQRSTSVVSSRIIPSSRVLAPLTPSASSFLRPRHRVVAVAVELRRPARVNDHGGEPLLHDRRALDPVAEADALAIVDGRL